MAYLAGWRQKISPAEMFLTTGECLLICKPAAARRNKCYKPNDRSALAIAFMAEPTSQNEPWFGSCLKINKAPHFIAGL